LALAALPGPFPLTPSLRQIPLHVRALGADYYVTNAHKWLFAARGCALLWVRRDLQGETHPPVISTQYGMGFTQVRAALLWLGGLC
jgi:selenocysteine lyase/cysteine desulfurase